MGTDPLDGDQGQRGGDEQCGRQPRPRPDLRLGEPLPLLREPCLEPAPEVRAGLDVGCLQRSHAALQGRFPLATRRALDEMPLETPPLPRGDDETVADIGVALAELETVHRTGEYTTGATEGFRNPYTPHPTPHA